MDLDSLPHYCRIHGLPESLLDQRARDLVYATGLERFLGLTSDLGLPGTLFAIGEDLQSELARARLKSACASGCEVACHSHAHDYALARKPDVTIARDLEQATEAIASAIGTRPIGFRAPGYTLSSALYKTLCAQQYRYDSSVFPSVPYFAAKAMAMGALAVVGRSSRAILDSPAVLLAPRQPYFPDPENPYRRGDGRVLELPIATTPTARFPFIGTFVATLPPRWVRSWYRSLRGSAFLNFELHAVDFLDERDGIPSELARQQRDLTVFHEVKISRLRETLQRLRDDFELATLAEAASRLS